MVADTRRKTNHPRRRAWAGPRNWISAQHPLHREDPPPTEADTHRAANHPHRQAPAIREPCSLMHRIQARQSKGRRNRTYAQHPMHLENLPPMDADAHREADYPHSHPLAIPNPCCLPRTAATSGDRWAVGNRKARNTPSTVRTCLPWTPMHTEKQTTPSPTHRRPDGNGPARKTPCTVRTRRPSDRALGKPTWRPSSLGVPKRPQ